MKVLLLSLSMALVSSCSTLEGHDHGTNLCQAGACKLDRSCCNNACGKCEGKDSCKKSSCNKCTSGKTCKLRHKKKY